MAPHETILPIAAYINNGEYPTHIIDCTGEQLMPIKNVRRIRLPRVSWIHGKYWYAVTAVDETGQEWYGRGSCGIAITLRARKGGK